MQDPSTLQETRMRAAARQRLCMKGFSQWGAAVGDKAQGFGQIVFFHRRLEVGERLEVGLGLASAPLHEEADDQPARPAHEPQSIGAAHPATVVMERHIQALVGAVSDPPALPVGLEPLKGGEFLGGQIGDEADRFVLASDAVAGQPGRLGGEGKAEVFGGDGAAFQGPALRSALVLFPRASPGGASGPEGEKPVGGTGMSRAMFWRRVGGLFLTVSR